MNWSCPICGRQFGDSRTLTMHLVETTKHESVITYLRRLEFMLAEAEDNLKFWREAVRMQPP